MATPLERHTLHTVFAITDIVSILIPESRALVLLRVGTAIRRAVKNAKPAVRIKA